MRPLYIVYDYTQDVAAQATRPSCRQSAQHTANEQKIGDFYASCMDEDAIYAEGLKPLQPELDRISALSDKKQLTDLLAHDQMINVDAFFSYSEQQDFEDARKQIAVVDQGGLGLPERDYYFRTGDADEKTRKDYVAHIATMLGLLGEPADKASADADKIMALETALAKVSMDVTVARDPNNVYHMMPTAQLAELTPAIDWPQFFARTGVPGIADLNVANPDFFKGLQAVLDSTDLETIKTYLRWQLVTALPTSAAQSDRRCEDFNFYGHELADSRCSGRAGSAVSRRPTAPSARRLDRSMWIRNFPPRKKPSRCKWSTTSRMRWTRSWTHRIG